ncbi:MAG TPA: TraC family protein [Patescibacteria group bacterium]|nr:TraC family protein [Patescibacteria group bacterium]
MSVLTKSNKKLSSRQQINIKGVQDGILLLPGNQYRLVLQASSINFELKSDEEQDTIIETYQNFLNSLTCPVQILIRVREMDMQKYLDDFRAALANEKEKIYRQQIINYTEFVQGLVTTNKILSRHFYVVIPYGNTDSADLPDIKEQLAMSADLVSKGLARLGIQTRQLDSLEVLDLFYSFYSPGQAKRQPLTNQTLQMIKESYL